MLITTDLIMSTRPCSDWPRERVDAVLAKLDTSSWTRLAESARDSGWPVSLADLRLTAYRAATPAKRLRGVRRSTRFRIEAQAKRWPTVSAAVARVRADLLRWAAGDDVDMADVRRRAYAADAASDADAAAAAYAAAYAAYAAADADADAAYAADAAAAVYAADAASADEAWAGLVFICNILDEVTP